MPDDNDTTDNNPNLPMRQKLEARFEAKVITYEQEGESYAGGMCRCCGCGPSLDLSISGEPWYIFQANLCDTDGVFYAMACQDCLEAIRCEYSQRKKNSRDLMAREIGEILGDDVDGAQAMMDDLEGFDLG